MNLSQGSGDGGVASLRMESTAIPSWQKPLSLQGKSRVPTGDVAIPYRGRGHSQKGDRQAARLPDLRSAAKSDFRFAGVSRMNSSASAIQTASAADNWPG